MKIGKERAAAILVGAILICGTLATAKAQLRQEVYRPGAFETVRESRLIGVSVVRLINTAEQDYRDAHGRFATWDELNRSGALAGARKRSPEPKGLALSTGPEVVPGWMLAIIVSHDGKTYQLSLRNVGDRECRFSFFSDPSGLVYQGSVVGCEPGS